jgi:hypothetical protein
MCGVLICRPCKHLPQLKLGAMLPICPLGVKDRREQLSAAKSGQGFFAGQAPDKLSSGALNRTMRAPGSDFYPSSPILSNL